jgi:hypothetical protein
VLKNYGASVIIRRYYIIPNPTFEEVTEGLFLILGN